MKEKEFTWYKIAEHIDEIQFAENNIGVVEINGKKICVGKNKNQLFAFAHTCPHAGGPLYDGYIDALGNIVCPIHRYKFDLRNGRNTTGEGYYLKIWPVEKRQDGVFVAMEERSAFWNLF